MTYSLGDTLTQEEINGIISIFCHFYEHHETFNYTNETIELDTCDIQILNGIYSDEELISELPLQIRVTNEEFECQRYLLAVDYYSYDPDTDNILPALNRKFFEVNLIDGVGEINFDGEDVVYIMLSNWTWVTKYDKPIITEVV